jgi:hypothetical protein
MLVCIILIGEIGIMLSEAASVTWRATAYSSSSSRVQLGK